MKSKFMLLFVLHVPGVDDDSSVRVIPKIKTLVCSFTGITTSTFDAKMSIIPA